MKQLFFTVAFGLAAFNATANNGNTTVVITEQNTATTEAQALLEEVVLEKSETVDLLWSGRCLDGHTFTFEAPNQQQAQKYVNDYCAERKKSPSLQPA